MIFEYPSQPHIRKHGPSGYSSYKLYKPWLRDEFIFQCVYCLMRETWYPNGEGNFSTDHFIPQIVAPHLAVDYDNLMYACIRCNSFKQDHIVLDPAVLAMDGQLWVKDDGTIEARTETAIEHIQILGLDDSRLTEYRKKMIDLFRRLQALPEEEVKEELLNWFGFPSELPNLALLRPPGGNSRPEGVSLSWYKQRQQGTIPEVY